MAAVATTGQQFGRTRGQLRGTADSSFGDIYWVNNADTNAATSGGFCSNAPITTLIGAQGLCNNQTNVTNYTDIVRIGPGHAESIIAAAGMTFSKPGVSYIGQGNGRQRPVITFSTSTAAQMIITGTGVSFQNMVFDFTGIDAIVAAISLQATDISFINCDFITNNATIGVVRGLYANTSGSPADRLVMSGCRFYGAQTNSGTTTTAQLDVEYGTQIQFINNVASGKMTQSVLNATAALDWFVSGNQFHVYTGTKAIALNSSTTGAIFSNRMVVASGTTPVVASGASMAGNNYTTEALAIGTPTASTF